MGSAAFMTEKLILSPLFSKTQTWGQFIWIFKTATAFLDVVLNINGFFEG